ncbi:MAG: TRAP transporter small permease [Rhodospirillales bacterium]|jgi:TRAP-type C4-dicarboxylate transport system permease small subunit|nr:TRAP transporter small permease [Rhodospirillales bacterium]
MDRLIAIAFRYSRYGVWFGGGLIILSAFIVAAEVLIRKFFNHTIGGADELSGFALAIGSAWAFSFALLERAHVRIDSVYVWLPVRARAILDLIGLTVFLLFMGLLAYQGTGVFTDSVELGSRTMSALETPLQYPQFFWVAGLYFFVVVAVLMLVRALGTAFRLDFSGVQRQIGSKTVSEELNAEMRDIERRTAEQAKHDGGAAQ